MPKRRCSSSAGRSRSRPPSPPRRQGLPVFKHPRLERLDLAKENRTAAVERLARRMQARARQSQAQAALQAHEHGPHARQEYPGLRMELPVLVQHHIVQAQRGGAGRAQACQVEVGLASQSVRIVRDGEHGGVCVAGVPRGERGNETLALQVGGPGHPTVQGEAARCGLKTGLQLVEATQELHRIGQPGRAGQPAVQQRRQQPARERTVRAGQHTFDDRALRPEHEGRAHRMPGQVGNNADRGARRAPVPPSPAGILAEIKIHTSGLSMGFPRLIGLR
jgi:hypothetical protein